MDQLSMMFPNNPTMGLQQYPQEQPLGTRNKRDYNKDIIAVQSLCNNTSPIHRPWMNDTSTAHRTRDHRYVPQHFTSNQNARNYNRTPDKSSFQDTAYHFETPDAQTQRDDLAYSFPHSFSEAGFVGMDKAQPVRLPLDAAQLQSSFNSIYQILEDPEVVQSLTKSQIVNKQKSVHLHPLVQSMPKVDKCPQRSEALHTISTHMVIDSVTKNNYPEISVPSQPTVQSQPMSLNIRAGLLQLQFQSILSSLDNNTSEWATIYQLQMMYKTTAENIDTRKMKMMYCQQSESGFTDVTTYCKILHEELVTRVENSLSKFQRNQKCLFDVHQKMAKSENSTSKGSYMKDLIEKFAAKGVPKRKAKISELPQKAIEIMSTWFKCNADYPYPSSEAYQMMSVAGNITTTQARKWFANKRIRSGFTKGLKVTKRSAEVLEEHPKRIKLY